MLFKISNGAVTLGGETVLENIDLEIRDKEKIAIVGRNGAGKTTLLKCITGEVELEEGAGNGSCSITKAGDPVIGVLEQITFTDESRTFLEEILECFRNILNMEARMQELVYQMDSDSSEELIAEYTRLSEDFERRGGYIYKKEYMVMVKKFGFSEDDLNRPISEFSGGQRTKIAFIKLLLSHPDILLLDEPTNHLDINTVRWLEDYIKSYKSAVVIVSHDRMFLEKTVDRVYEIEYGETHRYKGNYSAYERQKRAEYQLQIKDQEYRQKEIKRLTELVERFRYKATKASMAQSKLKQIERLKEVGLQDRYDLKSFHADVQPRIESVKKVFEAKDLVIGYDNPLAVINLEVLRGQRLAVMGGNGTGKSTFLKTIMGKQEPLSGSFEFGLKTETGYFDQQMAQYSSTKTVKDDVHDEFPELTETQVRTLLGSFLFSGDDVFKCVNDLSGGERVRLALAKIFKRRPNVLILDEPTNHMDIVGKETLENMLQCYEGTVILVSHDRYFINKIADRLLVFEDGGAVYHPYGYAEYEEKLKAEDDNVSVQSEKKEDKPKKDNTSFRDKGRRERKLKKLEDQIAKCEEDISSLESRLEDPSISADYVKLSEIQDEINRLAEEQERLTEEWITLSEEAES